MKYLFLSPHPDDVELSCGATISRLTNGGNEIYIAIFSDCGINGIQNEAKAAHKLLNVKETLWGYFPVRNFHEHRQDILQTCINLREAIAPDTVFIPDFYNDVHQDHMVVGMEARSNFRASFMMI